MDLWHQTIRLSFVASKRMSPALILMPLTVMLGCHSFEALKSIDARATPVADGREMNIIADRPATTSRHAQGAIMSNIHLVHDYRHPPEKVWRVLTDPSLMARWALNGRPEGFSTAVGTRFKLIGKPQPGWSGVIDCEVLEAREPAVLRYSWVADEGDGLQLTYRLEPHDGGTRFTFDQTGFTGIGGFFLAKVVMTPIRKKMFGVRIPALLNELDDEGTLRPGSNFKP
jgi:uncharacterized protein YndB with AHSA1/START domain